ncbi:MAG: choice-of-anchor B family protein [Phycisphaerae bacterium]
MSEELGMRMLSIRLSRGLSLMRARLLFVLLSGFQLPLQAYGEAPHRSGIDVGGAVRGDGLASAADGGFAASGVSLVNLVPLADFPGEQTRGSDIWGYTSPSGRQYALVCFRKGMAVVEVTDPFSPSIVEYIDGGGIDQPWRDVKTYGEYAYVVTDGEGVGLQIVDLSQVDTGVVTLADTTDLGFGMSTAHNIAINEESGFAYLCGGNLASGGIVAVDLADPLNPVIVGSWDETYVHDLQVVTYSGGPYDGQEIAFSFNGQSGFYVIDVTDKSLMTTRSSVVYDTLAYSHQGWLTDDRQYVIMNDELDELFGDVTTTTTYVMDVSDLDAASLHTTFTNGIPATDHNLFLRDGFMYAANYASGLRVFDVRDVNAAVEVGYFDTYPLDDNAGSSGAWAAYVGFPGSIVLLNDRELGLFILDAAALLAGDAAVPAASFWGLAGLLLSILAVGTVLMMCLRRVMA